MPVACFCMRGIVRETSVSEQQQVVECLWNWPNGGPPLPSSDKDQHVNFLGFSNAVLLQILPK
jgi:hypothetical protein